jgi:hypothetical protein
MSKWVKITIPLALGLGAMYLNYQAGTSRAQPTYYVMVNRDHKAGEKFTEDSVTSLVLYGARTDLKDTAIPFLDRASLFNQVCGRDLKKGDIVFWRDAAPPPAQLSVREGEVAFHISLSGISASLPELVKVGDEIGFYLDPRAKLPGSASASIAAPPASAAPASFEYVGPFRILSIGQRISADDLNQPGVFSNREITLAVRQQGGGKELDEKTTRLLQAQLASRAGQPGIVAIVFHTTRTQTP